MTDRRFYVSLTATCPETHLHEVLDRMTAAMSATADAADGTTVLDGLSLSFTRDDAEDLSGVLTPGGALPTALPVPDTGGQHAADQQLPAAPVPTGTDGTSTGR